MHIELQQASTPLEARASRGDDGNRSLRLFRVQGSDGRREGDPAGALRARGPTETPVELLRAAGAAPPRA